jgi:CRISPR-associated protein Cas1
MARELLNTLFVTQPDCFVRLDGETLLVEREGKKVLQVPAHHLGAVVLFGHAQMSSQAMAKCVSEGREVTFLDYAGRFKCRVVGPESGNVLLRAAQYDAYRSEAKSVKIAAAIVAAKIRNARQTLMRGARDTNVEDIADALRGAAADMAGIVPLLKDCQTLDEARGLEGQAAAAYFGVFGLLITAPTSEFSFQFRTRRPPRDRVNALLSFLYALLTSDCVAAASGVGLDSQFGYLHALRPGRPALALDLMEEFRSCVVDRLALNLINRRQLKAEHFTEFKDAGGSVLLNDAGRRIVLEAYQRRKQEDVGHPHLKTKTPLGLVPHLQARLLARHLRGDLAAYPPYLST